MPVIPTVRKLRQEDQGSKAIDALPVQGQLGPYEALYLNQTIIMIKNCVILTIALQD